MAQLAPVSKDDTIIAVMGLTGCGKTNFIAKACGYEIEHVNKCMEPKTPNLRTFRIPNPLGGHFVFVDTPGFDDSTGSDAKTLNIIADWLTGLEKQQARVRGVLYLHRITDNRMSNSALKNIKTFVRICGEKAMPNVVLVTTMWDTPLDKGKAEKREEELKRDFWRDILASGGITQRFMNTNKSAWDILNVLPYSLVTLQMDPELQEEENDAREAVPQQYLVSRWLHDIMAALFKKSPPK